MTKVLHVNGSTTQERHATIAAVDALLQACGASVTDYFQFSNVSAAVSYEIAAGKLREFAQGLSDGGIRLTQETLDDVERLSGGDAERMLTGTVQITFFCSEPVRERLHSHGTERLHW